MSSSFQAFPPPSAVYPMTGETNNPTTTPYHSSGSYGTVFVVLAIIVVVSAVACVLGRFCGKRSSGQPKTKKSKNQSHGRAHNKGDYSHAHGHGRSKERDVELGFGHKGADFEIGFDKKIPKVKVAPNGHGYGPHGPGYGPHGPGKQGQRPPQNGPGPGQYGGGGHRQLPMMECPRNF